MKKGFILIVGILLIALWIAYKVNTAQRLEFTMGLPKQVRFEGLQVKFVLPLQIRNPSNGSINLKSANMAVSTAGKQIGTAYFTQADTIAANATTVVNVTVAIGYLDLLSASSSILSNLKNGVVTLSLDGLVYAELFQVPINESFEFDTKQLKK